VNVEDGNEDASVPADSTFNFTVTAVNDAPTATIVPSGFGVDEDEGFVPFGGFSVSDSDAGSGNLEITLSVNDGLISLGNTAGLTFTGGANGTADMTFTANLTDANNALSSIQYAGNLNFNGIDTITLGVDDQGNTGSGGALNDSDSASITVSPVNDAPTAVDDAGVLDGAEDSTTATLNAALLANDSDLDGDGISISAINGTALVGGVQSIAVTNGTVNVDAADNITFTADADYNGAVSFDYTITDGTLTDTATASGTIAPANDAPVNSVPGAQTTLVNTPLLFSTGNGNLISVSDVDAGTIEVTLTATNGTVTLAGIGGLAFTTGTGTADGVMTFTGSIASVNTAMDGMRFDPNPAYTGAASVQIDTDDLGNTGAGGVLNDSDTVAVTVNATNAPPTATNLNAAESYTEDIPLDLINVVVTDADSANVTATLTLSDISAGTLNTGTSGMVTSTFAGGVWTASGAIADVNALLAGVTFTPAADFNGSFTIATSIDDGIAPAITGTKVVTGTAVDDASVLTVDTNTVNEDNPAAGNVLTNDSDVDDTLTVASFQVSGDATTYAAGNTATISGIGTIVLSSNGAYTFTPVADWNGSVPQVTYTTNTGSTSTLDITLTAVGEATTTDPTPPTLPVDDNDPDPIAPPDPEPEPSPEEEPAAEEETEEVFDEADALTEEDAGEAVTAIPPTAAGAVSAQQASFSNAPRGIVQRVLRGLAFEQGADTGLNEFRENPAENQAAWSVVAPRANALAFGTGLTDLGVQAVRALDFLENSLDGLKQEAEDEIALNQVAASSAIAVTTGLSVGYVAWLLRSGVLLSSLLSSMPAWRFLDPLPVLAGKLDDLEETDDESLETIIEQPSPAPDEDTPDEADDAADGKET